MAIQQQTGSFSEVRSEPERHEERGGFVFPTIVLAAGIIFLLNNLGVISWDVWGSIWQFWPVLLIAIGLELIVGRRSMWGSLILSAVMLAVLLGGVWWWSTQQSAWQPSANEQITRSLEGAERADVAIEFGIGTLKLSALSGSSELIAGNVDLGRGERTYTEFRTENGTAYYTLRSEASRAFVPFLDMGTNKKTWELGLNPDVPMKLRVNTGVGDATLNLAGVSLSSLELNAGTGNVNITLPREGRIEADLNAGVGQIEVNIPKGMAAHVEVNQGLGGVQVNGNYERSDDIYESPGYSSAKNRVDLKIDGGVGQVTIRETGND